MWVPLPRRMLNLRNEACDLPGGEGLQALADFLDVIAREG